MVQYTTHLYTILQCRYRYIILYTSTPIFQDWWEAQMYKYPNRWSRTRLWCCLSEPDEAAEEATGLFPHSDMMPSYKASVLKHRPGAIDIQQLVHGSIQQTLSPTLIYYTPIMYGLYYDNILCCQWAVSQPLSRNQAHSDHHLLLHLYYTSTKTSHPKDITQDPWTDPGIIQTPHDEWNKHYA